MLRIWLTRKATFYDRSAPALPRLRLAPQGGTFASGRGAIIQRGKQTVFMSWLRRLLQPLSKPQESACDAQLVVTNWASSQPHLALLEKFLLPREVKSSFLEWWAPAFGMNPQRVIDGLVAHGALELAPTVADLKTMLSSRGLKVSGKKADLIQRLLEADPKGLEVPYAHRMILQCTPAASQAVAGWKVECTKAFEMAAGNVIAALRNRHFKEAISTADTYRKNKFETPLPPGAEAMTIKSAPRSIEERAANLVRVFTLRPKLLEGLQPERWESAFPPTPTVLSPEQWEGLYLNYVVWKLMGRVAPDKCNLPSNWEWLMALDREDFPSSNMTAPGHRPADL